MTMAGIRAAYAVPAKRGMRVEYTAGVSPSTGVIVGSRGANLRIRLDGTKGVLTFHPTWNIRYLTAQAAPEVPK